MKNLFHILICVLCTTLLMGSFAACKKDSAGSQLIEGTFVRHRVDDQNTGAIPNGQSSKSPVELWSVEDIGGEWASPIIANGRMYVASNSGAGKPESFTCLDLKSGAPIWGLNIPTNFRASPTFSDGMIFIGSDNKEFFAIDVEARSVKWSVNTPRSFRGSPLILGDQVILADNSGAYALNKVTGETIWTKAIVNGTDGSIALFGDNLYLTTRTNGLLCLQATTGATLWEHNTSVEISGSPMVAGGAVYFATAKGGIFKMDALTGQLLWSKQFDHRLNFGSPSLAGEHFYISCSSTAPTVEPHRLVCLNAKDGEVVWAHVLNRPNTSDPIVFGDKVFVGDKDGVKRFDRATGDLLDIINSSVRKGGVNTTPAIFGKYLAFTNASGTVSLFEL